MKHEYAQRVYIGPCVGYLLTIHINQNEAELIRVHVGDEGGAMGTARKTALTA